MNLKSNALTEWNADSEVEALSTDETQAVSGGTFGLLSWLFGGWSRKSYGYGHGCYSSCRPSRPSYRRC